MTGKSGPILGRLFALISDDWHRIGPIFFGGGFALITNDWQKLAQFGEGFALISDDWGKSRPILCQSLEIVVTVFLSILNQIEFHLACNRKENCHHDHIPFNMKGNEILVLSV